MKNLKALLLIACLSFCLASCAILRTKDKQKTITQTDSVTTKSSLTTRVDTSSFESRQRITFEFPAGYFENGSYQDYSELAAQMIMATKNLAAETKAAAAGKPTAQKAAAAAAKPGLKAIIDTWHKIKNGVSETAEENQRTEMHQEKKQVDTSTTKKSYSWIQGIGTIAALIAVFIALYYIFRKK